jgi:hypothetical protein
VVGGDGEGGELDHLQELGRVDGDLTGIASKRGGPGSPRPVANPLSSLGSSRRILRGGMSNGKRVVSPCCVLGGQVASSSPNTAPRRGRDRRRRRARHVDLLPAQAHEPADRSAARSVGPPCERSSSTLVTITVRRAACVAMPGACDRRATPSEAWAPAGAHELGAPRRRRQRSASLPPARAGEDAPPHDFPGAP